MSSEPRPEVTESAAWAEYLRQLQLLCKDALLTGGYALLTAVVFFYNYILIAETLDEDYSDLPFYVCCLAPSLLVVIGGGYVVKSEIEANHPQTAGNYSKEPASTFVDKGKSPGRVLYEKTEQILNALLMELKKEHQDQETLHRLLDQLAVIVFKHESQSSKYNSGLWYNTLFNDIENGDNQLLREYLMTQPRLVHLTRREPTHEKNLFDQISSKIEALQKELENKETQPKDIQAALTEISTLVECMYVLPPAPYQKYWRKQTHTKLLALAKLLVKQNVEFTHIATHQLVAD
jgi:hypothetical protein